MNQRLKLFLLKFISRIRKRVLGPYTTVVIYEITIGEIVVPIEDLTIGRHLDLKATGIYSNF